MRIKSVLKALALFGIKQVKAQLSDLMTSATPISSDFTYDNSPFDISSMNDKDG